MINFEKEALSLGTEVKQYQTDNGIYTSKEYLKELDKKGQGLRLSGVGAHHQNGVAETSIKLTSYKACALLIHAAFRWPEVVEKDLWPMALRHAVYLHNIIPRMDTSLSPEELWTRSKGSNSKLSHVHTWGCPVYVLDPKLQNNQKIPKWAPRSRRAQYLGVSPLQASTVGLVRNLSTGRLSPQFHLVFDDWFETIHSHSDKPPPIWDGLLSFNHFNNDFDDPDFAPKLHDEWLTPQEQEDRNNSALGHDDQREVVVPGHNEKRE
jgi:hypothetical protein